MNINVIIMEYIVLSVLEMVLNILDKLMRIFIEILLVKNTDDVINGIAVNGQAREAAIRENDFDIVRARVNRNRHNVNTRRQDILGIQIVELNGALDELALLLVNAALLLRFLNEGEDLTFCNGRLLALPFSEEEEREKLFDPDEKENKRGQDNRKRLENGRHRHGKFLGTLLGNRFRADLAEDQNDDGHHDSRKKSAVVTPQISKKNSGNRG